MDKSITIYCIEVIDLSERLNENYAKEGKKMIDLIQEWIDENSYFFIEKKESIDKQLL